MSFSSEIDAAAVLFSINSTNNISINNDKNNIPSTNNINDQEKEDLKINEKELIKSNNIPEIDNNNKDKSIKQIDKIEDQDNNIQTEIRTKEDSDSEFIESEEEEEEEIEQEKKIAKHRLQIEEEEEEEEEEEDSKVRRSTRKRKKLSGRRSERANKIQKTEHDEWDKIEIKENPEEIKEKTDILHKSWKFLVVLHFIEHFRDIISVPETINIPDLELAVITCNKSKILRDLIIFLLKKVRCSVGASEITWFRVLNIVLNRHSYSFEDGNPVKDIEEENFFKETSLTTKIEILHFLCEWVLSENSSLLNKMKENRGDDLFIRPLPLGWDKEENAYWRFGNSDYIYKEVNMESENGYWELVCSTVEEWESLASKFKDSKDTDEQEFYSYLTEDLIPPLIQKQEQELKKQRRLGRYHINTNNIIYSNERPRRSTRKKTYCYDEAYES